jgi:hypothetical protein
MPYGAIFRQLVEEGMTFHLQYRDAPSDSPLVEYRSPLPLAVPRTGDKVQLFTENSVKLVSGVVQRVEWGYRPRHVAAGDAAGETELDIAARVWLTQD